MKARKNNGTLDVTWKEGKGGWADAEVYGIRLARTPDGLVNVASASRSNRFMAAVDAIREHPDLHAYLTEQAQIASIWEESHGTKTRTNDKIAALESKLDAAQNQTRTLESKLDTILSRMLDATNQMKLRGRK